MLYSCTHMATVGVKGLKIQRKVPVADFTGTVLPRTTIVVVHRCRPLTTHTVALWCVWTRLNVATSTT